MARIEPKSIMDTAAAANTDAPPAVQSHQLEEQLATIIASARSVAVAAEELLRELTHTGLADRPANHAIAMAPRLLAATEQQLASVSAMLRKA
ncbi:MAG: hypothetical protein ACRCTI_18580 [Beijerinckiaceae bacterium]